MLRLRTRSTKAWSSSSRTSSCLSLRKKRYQSITKWLSTQPCLRNQWCWTTWCWTSKRLRASSSPCMCSIHSSMTPTNLSKSMELITRGSKTMIRYHLRSSRCFWWDFSLICLLNLVQGMKKREETLIEVLNCYWQLLTSSSIRRSLITSKSDSAWAK